MYPRSQSWSGVELDLEPRVSSFTLYLISLVIPMFVVGSCGLSTFSFFEATLKISSQIDACLAS